MDPENGYVVDDSVQIRVEVTVRNVCGAAFETFSADSSLLSDVALQVEDSIFHVNKGVSEEVGTYPSRFGIAVPVCGFARLPQDVLGKLR